MEQYFIIIHPNGRVEKQRAPEENKQLEFLQEAVGGYIETVPCGITSEGIIIVNEEGKLKNLPENPLASKISKIYEGDYIVGTAVFAIVAGEDILALPPTEAEMFANFIKGIGGDANG